MRVAACGRERVKTTLCERRCKGSRKTLTFGAEPVTIKSPVPGVTLTALLLLLASTAP